MTVSRRAFRLFVTALATGAITVSGANATSAGKVRVVIAESGAVSQPLQGRFVLSGPGVSDSGSSSSYVGIGPVRFRGGQRYEIHSGVDAMTGKKGALSLSFTGPSANAGPNVYVEYGTWHVSTATGIYKGWKGSGNWAGTDNGTTYHFQFEGLITR